MTIPDGVSALGRPVRHSALSVAGRVSCGTRATRRRWSSSSPDGRRPAGVRRARAAWHVPAWRRSSRRAGVRPLDAFPPEFGAIPADHEVIAGSDPFEGLGAKRRRSGRRASGAQSPAPPAPARETRGRGDRLAELIARSAAPFAALMMSVARLNGGAAPRDAGESAVAIERAIGLQDGSLIEIMKLSAGRPLSTDTARRIFPAYLDAVERLTNYIDRWSAR